MWRFESWHSSFSHKRKCRTNRNWGANFFTIPTFKGTIDPSKATGLTCANCHADFDEAANPDGVIRAGHSVLGVPHRGEAKGGMIKAADFARAAGGGGFCYEHFLQRVPGDKVNPTAIPAEHAEALMAYFETISGDNKGPEFEIAMLDDDAKKAAGEKIAAMSGDASNGWQLFGRTCITCHPTAKKGWYRSLNSFAPEHHAISTQQWRAGLPKFEAAVLSCRFMPRIFSVTKTLPTLLPSCAIR